MKLTPIHAFGQRSVVVALLLLSTAGIIIFRLAYLQIHLSNYFLDKSKKNFLRYEPTAPLRGNILDNNGKFLATNRSVTNVYWRGTGNKKLNDEQHKILERLLAALDLDINIFEKNYFDKAERCVEKKIILEDASFDQLSKIAEQFSHNENIIIESTFSRYYPYKMLASHTLGYLEHRDFDMIGKMGLEKLYNDTLHGSCGITEKIQNSFGKNLQQKEIQESQAGQDISITIDTALQIIIEKIFPADHSGSLIVMDSYTGALNAILSRPDFDPNIFLKPIDQETWKKLQENRPFIHRVFNASYPPGSLFKLVTISAILETNLISPQSTWYCGGYSTLGSNRFGCARTEGHGLLTIAQSVARSCNVLFFEVGKKLDIDVLAKYAGYFGLGKSTNSMFKELIGLVPSRAWKKATKGERWWTGETLSAAIGQSYLLVTPIQIARMIASIESGVLVTPHVIKTENITTEVLPIKAETRKFLQDTMRETVLDGTAIRLRRFLKQYNLYAKTSTAQTSDITKRLEGKEFMEHAWIAVNFSYKNMPSKTLIILIENAGSSRAATAVAEQFLIAYRELMELRISKEKERL